MRLLRTARASVAMQPGAGDTDGRIPERVLFIAGIFEQQGERYLATGQNEDALACFSYGHGWLDAAVTSGLFRIMADGTSLQFEAIKAALPMGFLPASGGVIKGYILCPITFRDSRCTGVCAF